jgi:hypothetical protein
MHLIILQNRLPIVLDHHIPQFHTAILQQTFPIGRRRSTRQNRKPGLEIKIPSQTYLRNRWFEEELAQQCILFWLALGNYDQLIIDLIRFLTIHCYLEQTHCHIRYTRQRK